LFINPVTSVECVVAPVVVNAVGRAAYAVPGVVPYRHVAFSSVVKLKVVCVVPAGNIPVG
jgi:hypothetical protein